jgi:hypothetical protein
MAEDSEQDKSEIIHQSDSSGSSIQSSEQSDLIAINKNLTERIKQAKTPKEILEYLKLKDYVQNQALKQIEQETAKLRLQEAKDQINFNRRLAITREIRTIVASTITVAIGLYSIASSPVFGALLITLGLAKPLEYSAGEISDLLKNLSELIKQFPDLFVGNKKRSQETDESSRGRSDENEG